MRDTKSLQMYTAKMVRKAKEQLLQRLLRKEVETGANGTQDYIIKKGPNAGQKASKSQCCQQFQFYIVYQFLVFQHQLDFLFQ